MAEHTNTKELDKIIYGRGPHIYAFSTDTVPNYWKVGDTYRHVEKRLSEWRVRYPNLEKKFEGSARVEGEEKYFRDYSVHLYLERNGKERLKEEDLEKIGVPEGTHYSSEFFKDIGKPDLENAIKDINEYYKKAKTNSEVEPRGYTYYDQNGIPEQVNDIIEPKEYYMPRKNQQDVIDNFKKAVDNGRTNLLMYAVMRFGKSFTAMCCAQKIKAKFVVIVSAKADVKNEWEKTILRHTRLNHKSNSDGGYYFYARDAYDMDYDEYAIKSHLENGERVALFLTLQYLNGKNGLSRFNDILGGEKIDLLIVDETHFGARGEKLGASIRDSSDVEADLDDNGDNLEDEFEEIEDADETIKPLKGKDTVMLHLSGTPYRILLNDNEFEKEDIISFVQYSDIIQEQDEWDKKNVEKLLTGEKKEWDNPYYGFPQMIRFAFNLNKSSREMLEGLKKKGKTADLSTLFYPKSITKDNKGKHRKFAHWKEVLDLLKVIDGSKEDDELMGFLDYDGFKKGDMCRHIVMVLPYRASCDAMARLIEVENKKKTFNNIKDYNILNISGFDCPKEYNTVEGVKAAIKRYENNNEKTITLTVDRMLTGSTVEEWDTMFFMKGTKSPQEYDQATFRLQNKYVKDVVEEKKDSSDTAGTISEEQSATMKVNMKPQTLLVDFDPNRMFVMQERRTQIYGMYSPDAGYDQLKKHIQNELDVSPIIRLNANKLTKIDAVDIMEAVSDYNNDKGIAEEALDISVDLRILDECSDVFAVIKDEMELGTKGSLKTRAAKNAPQGQEGSIDMGDEAVEDADDAHEETENKSKDGKKDKQPDYAKKIQNYYARILLYAFVTDDKVYSLSEILDSIRKYPNRVCNQRIARNLGLNEHILEQFHTFYCRNNMAILHELSLKITDMNELSHNENPELSPIERSEILLKKLKKLDNAIVVTPSSICNDMVGMIPREELIKILKGEDGYNCRILDPASVAGEFAAAIFNFYTTLSDEEKRDIPEDNIKNCVYSIPKSSVCYELTLKTYNMLGLNTDNVATKYDSFDLIDQSEKQGGSKKKYEEKLTNLVIDVLTQDKKFNEISLGDTVDKGDKKMNYDIVIGNPPYQIETGGSGRQAKAIYQLYVEQAKEFMPKYISMIIPSRWFSGGFGLDDFRKEMLCDTQIRNLVDYPNTSDVFGGVDIAGGICYFLWEKNSEGKCAVSNVINGDKHTSFRKLNEYDTFVRYSQAIPIIRKVFEIEKPAHTLEDTVSPQKPFGLPTNYTPKDDGIPCYFIQKIGKRYASESDVIDSNHILDKWKLLVPKSPIAGQTDFTRSVGFYYDGNTIIARPGECCTESFIVAGAFDTEIETNNFKSYLFTKTVRFLLLQAVVSQDVLRNKFCFVPALETYDKQFSDQILIERWHITDEEWTYIDSRIHNYR